MPSFLFFATENIDIIIPCVKNKVFLIMFTILNLLMPFPAFLNRKKNQLLYPYVLISF